MARERESAYDETDAGLGAALSREVRPVQSDPAVASDCISPLTSFKVTHVRLCHSQTCVTFGTGAAHFSPPIGLKVKRWCSKSAMGQSLESAPAVSTGWGGIHMKTAVEAIFVDKGAGLYPLSWQLRNDTRAAR